MNNETTKNAIETAAYAAGVNANHATTAAIEAKKRAEEGNSWTAQTNLDEAEKYQAIAEAFATVAGDTDDTRNLVAGSASLLRAAQEAVADAKRRYLEKQKTEAIRDLIREITKNLG